MGPALGVGMRTRLVFFLFVMFGAVCYSIRWLLMQSEGPHQGSCCIQR